MRKIHVFAFMLLLLCLPEARADFKNGCFEYTESDLGNTSRVLYKYSITLLKEDSSPDSLERCRHEECRAIRDLTCTGNAYAHWVMPNSMSYNTPKDAAIARSGYSHTIQLLGRTHPRRIPLYCRLLARVAATINGDEAHDGRTVNDVMDMAIRLNRPQHACLAEVVAAVPDTPAAQVAIGYARACLPHVERCQRTMLDPPRAR